MSRKQYIELINHKEENSWIYNVLDGTKEKELQVYRDEFFMLGKDWQYNEGDVETLHLLALPRQLDPPLYTIRELNQSHLPLLYSIRDNSYATIEKLFGVPRCEIRAFFHYHPTYYHLHVHFCHVKMTSKPIQVGRAVFLNDVIQNIELAGDYYQKAKLITEIKENTKLFDLFVKNNMLTVREEK